MEGKLGFGLIGCGEIAVQTSKEIARSEVARVVHCTDPVGSVAEDLARQHVARWSEDLERLLGDAEVQAVVISTPHHLHAPLAIRAAQAGKHVLVEKPIACTLNQADAMIEAAARAGVLLGVLHPLRYGGAPQRVRELVRAGAIGDVIGYKMHAMGDKPTHYWTGGYSGRVKSDWRTSLEKSGGGYLIMNSVHSLDTMISITDARPTRIYAEYGTFRTAAEVEDSISFVMRLENGAIVSLDASSVACGKGSFGDRVYGTKGQIALGDGGQIYLDSAFDGIPVREWSPIGAQEPPCSTRRLVIDGFARAAMEGGDPPVSGTEARRSLEIVRGAYLSMARGRPVEFPVQE